MTVPAQIPVIDANNVTVAVNAPLAPGRAVAAESRPVALSNEDSAALTLLASAVKLEDTVAASGDPGIPAWAIRRDTPASSEADGDYGALTLNSTNQLWVAMSALPALVAGSAIIGKVGLDLSTPGTTNLVASNLQFAGSAAAVGAGAVGVTVQRMTLASDDPAVAALTTIANATSTVNVADDSSVLKIGATSVTPKFAKIAVSASGVNVVVAAVAAKKIRVLSYVLVSSGIVNAKWQSHTTPTDLTGLDYMVANTGVSAAYSPVGLFETIAGESLDLNLSAAIAVGGHLTYIEV